MYGDIDVDGCVGRYMYAYATELVNDLIHFHLCIFSYHIWIFVFIRKLHSHGIRIFFFQNIGKLNYYEYGRKTKYMETM